MTYSEAINGPDKEKWVKAIVEEKESLEENETWNCVDEAEIRKVINQYRASGYLNQGRRMIK